MNQGNLYSDFEFSPHFDRQFLQELYGSDLNTAAEVFQSTREQLIQELRLAEFHFSTGEHEEIRRVFHKIKPLFGYVGLTAVQDCIEQFEDHCLKARVADELKVAFSNICIIVREAENQIREEQYRLVAFNKKRA